MMKHLPVYLTCTVMGCALAAASDPRPPVPVVGDQPPGNAVLEMPDAGEGEEIVIESELRTAPASFTQTVSMRAKRGVRRGRGFPFDEFAPSDRDLLLEVARFDTRETRDCGVV